MALAIEIELRNFYCYPETDFWLTPHDKFADF